MVVTCRLHCESSLDKGQGHRVKKGENRYSHNVNPRLAITLVL